MSKNKPAGTSVKFPPGLVEMMDKEIENYSEFRNRSELIVFATRDFILKRQESRRLENEDFIASSGSLQSDQNIKTK